MQRASTDRRKSRRWSLEDYVQFSEDIGEVAEREDNLQREIDSYLRIERQNGILSPVWLGKDV